MTSQKKGDGLGLDGLYAGYGDGASVLRDVSLTVPTGRVVALLGPNGAGKTTLLRVAAGLLPPERGSVTWNGADMTRTAAFRRARQGLCLIPEGRGIFRDLSVRENLRMFPDTGRPRAETIEVSINAFPVLGKRLNQLAGSMSGGEQQMLAMARAFASGAKIVLADEVSMGLAPIIVDQIFEALSGLRQLNLGMLVVEQYAHRVLEFADTVYIMAKGSVVFSDTAEECKAREEEIFSLYLGAVG